MKLIQFIIF